MDGLHAKGKFVGHNNRAIIELGGCQKIIFIGAVEVAILKVYCVGFYLSLYHKELYSVRVKHDLGTWIEIAQHGSVA